MKKMLLSLLLITSVISAMGNKFSVETPIKMPSAAIIRMRILNRDLGYNPFLSASSLDTSLADKEIALREVGAKVVLAVAEYNKKDFKNQLDPLVKFVFEKEIIGVLLEDFPQEHTWLAEFFEKGREG